MPKPIYAQEEKIATRYNHFMKNRESKTSMGAGGARGMAGGSGMGSRSPVQTFGRLPTFRETESFIYTKLMENSNCKSHQ